MEPMAHGAFRATSSKAMATALGLIPWHSEPMPRAQGPGPRGAGWQSKGPARVKRSSSFHNYAFFSGPLGPTPHGPPRTRNCLDRRQRKISEHLSWGQFFKGREDNNLRCTVKRTVHSPLTLQPGPARPRPAPPHPRRANFLLDIKRRRRGRPSPVGPRGVG